MLRITSDNGVYSAVSNAGILVGFEDYAEAYACAELYVGIMRLLGHELQISDCIDVQAAEPTVRERMEKRSVRINIDTDVEYIGEKKIA